MKNIFYFFSAIILLTLVSCSKSFDANQERTNQKTTEFSIIANAPEYDASTTKGTLGAVARVFWELSDKIDVYQVSGETTTYLGVLEATTVSDTKTTATFTGTLDIPATTGNLAFIYPSNEGSLTCCMVNQTIETNGRVPFCAFANTTYTSGDVTANSIDFSLASSYISAIVVDNLADLQSYSISSIRISNINNKVVFSATEGKIGLSPSSGSEGKIIVNYSSQVPLSSGKGMVSFAVPVSNESTARKFVISDGSTFYSGTFASSAIDAAKFYSTAITDFSEISFVSNGEFSVSSNKKVKFAKSNLYWDGYDWDFEINPWDYPTSWSASHAGHLFWTKLDDYNSGNAAYMPYASPYSYSSQKTYDSFFCRAENPLTVSSLSGWYTLTQGEWAYLLKSRSNAANKYGLATVAGKAGLIILPDNFTDPMKNGESNAFVPGTEGYGNNVYTSGGNWEAMESAGAVFLPAMGYRISTWDSRNFIYSTNYYGFYWMSTPSYNAKSAYCLFFKSGEIDSANSSERQYGQSIRLVRN